MHGTRNVRHFLRNFQFHLENSVTDLSAGKFGVVFWFEIQARKWQNYAAIASIFV